MHHSTYNTICICILARINEMCIHIINHILEKIGYWLEKCERQNPKKFWGFTLLLAFVINYNIPNESSILPTSKIEVINKTGTQDKNSNIYPKLAFVRLKTCNMNFLIN